MAGGCSSAPMSAVAMLVAAAGLAAAPPGAILGVDAWIEQLGAPQFARREAAARRLVETGSAAVVPLERAVLAGDLEVASRGVEVLRQILDADDAPDAAALRSLERLATGTSAAVSRLAASAVRFHVLAHAATARERLESLGATFREPVPLEGRGLEVECNAAWRGRPDDLLALARLPRLSAVSLHGVVVNDAVLAMLADLREVRRLELFGTGAGPDEARMLAERLPDARIDVRRGGRLGITSQAVGGPCEIRIVEPGSAADQAGLRSGDVVLAIDGTAIASIDDLTARLGERAPGQVVRLTVARRDGAADGEPERIECEVRLDAW